jgi:short-subunit dehydrogenase
MSGVLEGKVAFITGAGRGQGRSHAVRMAQEGADIIAVDICADVESASFGMATAQDLAETVRLVEATGRRIVSQIADVRDMQMLQAAADAGMSELGPVSIVVANAGIAVQVAGRRTWLISEAEWRDVIDVNLSGVFHTIKACVPAMIKAGAGGTVLITGSTAGIKGMTDIADYASAKHGLTGLMRTLAREVAEYSIRVHIVHPTGVRTKMIENDAMTAFLAASADMSSDLSNMLPVELLEPEEISDAMIWLASDAARHLTSVSLPVDAGFTQK